MACECRCCVTGARAGEMLEAHRARMAREGRPIDPHLWYARPADLCYCPAQPAGTWCRCGRCLSWLRRAPRCRLEGCSLPLLARPLPGHAGLCPLHASERDRQRRANARQNRSVRRPPRPPHERTKGACSMCGTSPLPGRRRSWCSDACVDLWNLAASPAFAKGQLLALHGAVCWTCGRQDPAVELEHARPLWALTEEERAELRWWLPFNLTLMCPPCHRAKSRAEAAERAALRRAAS